MRVAAVDTQPQDSAADLVCIGLFDDGSVPGPFSSVPGAGDVRGEAKKLTLLRPGKPERLLVVGLGKRGEFDAERARVAAAQAVRQSQVVNAASIAWALPDAGDPAEIAAALVDGTILASYKFDRYKQDEDAPTTKLESLEILAGGSSGDIGDAIETARVADESANRARELQNLPANVVTPSYLAARAEEIAAAHDGVSFEALDRAEIESRGMGGLTAVSKGTAEEPRMIVLRYEGGGPGPKLGLVGKAVTFDSGGISIKPAAGMHEMKMDMSGGAVVIEAVDAIATLGLAVDIVAVVPSTENLPSGTAVKPGDVITQLNGKTVEITNTDAEGRLILADALSYAVELGAERLVDLATLTGAVLIALGSTYAALISNNDDWAAEVAGAATESGEIAWRLPLHAEYKELTKGSITDLVNASAKRKAGTIYAGSFLEEFVGDTPWVHLDIAGTAWDTGREYWGKGPTGFGVRLLVALAQHLGTK